MMIEVKICENCNHRNPVNAVECEQCGYDLTFVFPQKVDDTIQQSEQPNGDKIGTEAISMTEKTEQEWELVSITNESCRYSLGTEIFVGRDCDIFNDQFNTSNYTSRRHAKLRVFNNVVQVMDASTNGTFVDKKRIPKMEWVEVNDGSTIRFADISFRIRRKQGAD